MNKRVFWVNEPELSLGTSFKAELSYFNLKGSNLGNGKAWTTSSITQLRFDAPLSKYSKMAPPNPVPLFSYLLGFNIIASLTSLILGTIIIIKSQSELINSYEIYCIVMVVGIACLVVSLILLWNAIDILILTIKVPEHMRCLSKYKRLVENDMTYCFKGQVAEPDKSTSA